MSKSLVLITGATGHLGFRTLVIALENGYRARVAIRRLEQADKLKNTESLKKHLDSVEFVQVKDITAAGAYGDAIKGVDYVLHIASPIYSGLDPNDKDWKKLLYDPAERGTLEMLEAANSEPSVKKVVITSSVAAVAKEDGQGRIGPQDIKTVPDEATRNSLQASNEAYAVSKVLSHLAGTKFAEEKKPHFDLIRVLPGYIQGANELYTSAEAMQDEAVIGSNEGTIFVALGKVVGHPRITAQVFLDDVAKGHVYSLKDGVAKNLDVFIVAGNSGDSVSWKEYVPIIKKLFPEAVEKGIINPNAEDEDYMLQYDVSSSEKALGFKFAGPEEQVKSLVGQYVRLATTA